MEELVQIENNKAFTTSRKVAQKFNKEHKVVLRAIKGIENQEFSRNNFVPSQYLDSRGKYQPEFIMSRDGFSLLVMGFTGKEAENFKIEFIVAFNKAEEKLKNTSLNNLSIEEMMIHTLQARIEDRKRMDQIESKVDKLIEIQHDAAIEIDFVERSEEKMPEETLRAKIRKLVNVYCRAKLKQNQEVWNLIYDRLYYRYHIQIKKYKKKPNESWLDVAERNEFLDKIFVIASNELTI